MAGEILSVKSLSVSNLRTKSRKVGSVCELMDFFLNETDQSIDYATIHAFLYTYRIFSDIQIVLEIVDKKSLQVLLHLWLYQPYLNDFDSPEKLKNLQKLLRIITRWYDVFQPTLVSGRSNLWPNKLMDQRNDITIPLRNPALTRVVLCNMDKQTLDSLGETLRKLCKTAGHCLRSLSSKHLKENYSNLSSPTSSSLSDTQSTHYTSSSIISVEHEDGSVISLIPNFHNPLMNLWNLNVETLAEQFTIIDQRLFLQLETSECLNYARGKPAPTIQATIDQFNKIFHFVQSSLFNVTEDYPITIKPTPSVQPKLMNTRNCPTSPPVITIWSSEQSSISSSDIPGVTLFETENYRTGCIITWIEIAWQLMHLRNYSAVKAIILALQSAPIHRLKHSWVVLEYQYEEYYHKFERLNSLVSFENNQAKLREQLNICAGKMLRFIKQKARSNCNGSFVYSGNVAIPSDLEKSFAVGDLLSAQNSTPVGVIPYLGVFLSDLTLLNQSASDFISPSKMDKIFESRNSISDNKTNSEKIKAKLHGKLLSKYRRLSLSQSMANLTMITSNSATISGNKNIFKKSKDPKQKFANLISSTNQNGSIKSVGFIANENRRYSVDHIREEKQINFDKHQREFAILVRLFLLQQCARLYDFKKEPEFKNWLESYPFIKEDEILSKSMLIEPDKEMLKSNKNTSGQYQKSDRQQKFIRRFTSPQILTSPLTTPTRCSTNSSTSSETIDTRYNSSIITNLKENNNVDKSFSSSNHTTPNSPRLLSKHAGITNITHLSNCLKADKHILEPLKAKYLSPEHCISVDQNSLLTSCRSNSHNDLANLKRSNITCYSFVHEDNSESDNSLVIQITFQHLSSVNKNISNLHDPVNQSSNLVARIDDNRSRMVNSVVKLKVKPTDKVVDVIRRILKRFSCSEELVKQYDLVRIRKNSSDLILQPESNILQLSDYNDNNYQSNKLLEFICVPRLHKMYYVDSSKECGINAAKYQSLQSSKYLTRKSVSDIWNSVTS